MLNLTLPDTERRWSLPNIVFVTYTLFLAGFYFVPNAVDLYKFYIAAVFFPGLFLLAGPLRRSRQSPIWLSLLVYLAYMLLSSLWSDDFSGAALWRDVRYTAYILSFILLTLYLFERNRLLPDAVMQLITLVVLVAAAFAILTFEDLLRLPVLTQERLFGPGTTDNPNPSAFIYGFFGVIALDYARHHWGEKLAYVNAAGLFVIVFYVILTQSNTSLLALATACALLFLVDGRRANRASPALLAGLLLGLASAIYLAWSLGLLGQSTDLGFMNRLPIWRHILEQWPAAPIFGHGYQKLILLEDTGEPGIINYAHSVFLSTLRDGGLVGLALLLLVYACCLRSALKMALIERRALYLCLLVFGVVCALVDNDQLVTRPRELWIILWLPLACLVAYEVGLIGAGSSGSLAMLTGRSPKNIR